MAFANAGRTALCLNTSDTTLEAGLCCPLWHVRIVASVSQPFDTHASRGALAAATSVCNAPLLSIDGCLEVQGAQLVCLGTGDTTLEDGLRWLEGTWPDQARGWVGFNVPFSHRLTAAADILLMPSRFEPCGLNQMYAMTYGTVPVAHATGVLLLVVAVFAALSGC